MRYPTLVRPRDCKTDIEVTIYGNDIDEDGAPVIVMNRKLKCNYQGSGAKRYDSQHMMVELSGIALLTGDPFPELASITSGEAIIYGETHSIHKGRKERNPDGTVNYTRLELV